MATDWSFIREVVAADSPETERVMLWGPPGIGKSFVFIHGQPVRPVVITCSEDSLSSDFYGGKMPRDGTMVWQDGPALVAARQGKPLLLNEIDKASPAIHDVLYMLADDPESRVLTVMNGEGTQYGNTTEVVPEPGYRVFATSNFAPDKLPEALADRFLCLAVDEPAPEALDILPEHLREAARILAGHPDPVARVTLRSFRRYVGLTKHFGDKQAARAAFGARWKDFIDADRLAALVDKARAVK